MQTVKKILFIALFFSVTNSLVAQDTLPGIKVVQVSNKVIISWRTTYGARITAINIQRSADSLRGFSSIGSVLEPNNRENGFVDAKAPDSNQFYRVFIAFQGGRYLFSRSYRPAPDTLAAAEFRQKKGELSSEFPVTGLKPEGFMPSKYVFTGRDNNVIIELPDVARTRYTIEFFNAADEPVFSIARITEPYLIIEKVNFLYAGWYYFTLFENGIMKEKHRLYISKDGRNGPPPPEPEKKK